MIARAWDDPDAVPDVVELLHESGPLSEFDEVALAALLRRVCDAHDIGEGRLAQRLYALLELGLQRQADARDAQHGRLPRPVLSERLRDVLDSLVGCELTTKQLCEDTGRTLKSVQNALDRLRWQRLVSRERRGAAWTYRATAYGVRVLRGGGR